MVSLPANVQTSRVLLGQTDYDDVQVSTRAKSMALEPLLQADQPRLLIQFGLSQALRIRVFQDSATRSAADISQYSDPSELDEAQAVAEALRPRAARAAEGLLELAPSAAEKARAIVFGESRTLSEPSSLRVLEACGIRVFPWRQAETPLRATVHARTLTYPVDLRLFSPELDLTEHPQLVALDLRTPQEVRDAFRTVQERGRAIDPTARLLGARLTIHQTDNLMVRVLIEGETQQVIFADPRLQVFSPALEGAVTLHQEHAEAWLTALRGAKKLLSDPERQHLAELLAKVARVAVVLGPNLRQVRADLMTTREGSMVHNARLSVHGDSRILPTSG